MGVEVKHLDRDPKTGHLLPGHSVSSKAAKICAHKLAELRSIYYESVTQQDMLKAHAALMDCIEQNKDMKVRLAAIALLFDRCLGKPEQNIHVQSESRTLAAQVNISAEQQQVLEQIIASNSARQIPTQ